MTEAALVPPATNTGRIVSMDQFRGYTVLGMFIVNYLGHFDNVYTTLLHNDYFFSYADTIMPAFIFAVGFSFRLTILKRLPQLGKTKTYLSYVRRSLALILVSVAIFGIGHDWGSYSDFYVDPDIEMNERELEGFLRTPEDQLNEEAVRNEIRKQVAAKEMALVSTDEPLAGSEEQALNARIQRGVDQNYELFLTNHEYYQEYMKHEQAQNAKKGAAAYELVEEGLYTENELSRDRDYQRYTYYKSLEAEKAELEQKLFSGEIQEADLSVQEQELIDSDIWNPEYTGAPYFWSHMGKTFALVLKSDLWETLAVIGVTQLVVLPFIHLPFWSRFGVMVLFGLGHMFITYIFNWQFFFGYTEGAIYINPEHGLNNWMGQLWGTGNNRGWDGGCFGVFAWAVAMFAGSLSFDIMNGEKAEKNVVNLLGWGAGFMVIAYLLSGLANFYDSPRVIEQENKQILADNGYYEDDADREMSVEEFISSKNDEVQEEIRALLIEPAEASQVRSNRAYNQPASPVIPPLSQLGNRSWSSYIPNTPFTQEEDYLIGGAETQMANYWLLWKRVVTLPFIMFATGFAFVVLALFVVLCDIGGVVVPVFRTFGMNPLAAYAIHEVIMHAFLPEILPDDAGPWFIFWSMMLFLVIVWAMVRSLEKQNIYVRM
ncbi:hypothetical protein Pla110_08070 [Polystyrenella longa]|uniref:Heparan-alpha-glucosaminide N-acetyltransferase catalytic domain-containing protein n=1 Tax=Polystyrenella longa TaxID=2528007 RepID=A0A518CIP4_9PLAN|nr:hypothetical protein [Polystyrenella longa]QDU79103.1 hypothetical protein Pla110_08070 [Polystyrenella longa]